MSDLVQKLRYMGRQYAAGQVARGGEPSKHYLEEAADEIEALSAEKAVLVEALRAATHRLEFLFENVMMHFGDAEICNLQDLNKFMDVDYPDTEI